MSKSRSASERAWGGGRTGAGCVDKRGFSPLVRWCFFRPAREGKRADFGTGTRAGVARCRRVQTRSGRAGKRTSAIAADPPLTVPSPPALGSGAASAMSPSSQKIPVSADRLDETPDRPRARLFARVNRPPHRPRVRYDDPRVRLSSRRTEWTIRASGEVHRHTTRRPPVLPTPPSVHNTSMKKKLRLWCRACAGRRWYRAPCIDAGFARASLLTPVYVHEGTQGPVAWRPVAMEPCRFATVVPSQTCNRGAVPVRRIADLLNRFFFPSESARCCAKTSDCTNVVLMSWFDVRPQTRIQQISQECKKLNRPQKQVGVLAKVDRALGQKPSSHSKGRRLH